MKVCEVGLARDFDPNRKVYAVTDIECKDQAELDKWMKDKPGDFSDFPHTLVEERPIRKIVKTTVTKVVTVEDDQ